MTDNDSTFLCPRRDESFGGPSWAPKHDDWRSKDPRRTCSYCGSLHPDDFFAAIRAGMVIGPTDKNYKAYVTEPMTAEQKAASRQQMIGLYVGAGLTEEEATQKVDSEPFLGEGAHVGKFYFQHLSEEQRVEFIDLLNAKSITIGYPGYFYVLPFFTRRVGS